ncbi:hypothetical protein MMC25_007346 [Agyrium rufum]|nr:hypothetical protein [Agyrium rufum]
MPSSCKDIRAALAACLQSSDCVLIDRNKPSDCLKNPLVQTLPTRCQQLRQGYTDCKYVKTLFFLRTYGAMILIFGSPLYRRGMVDMRKRFRGNQAFNLSEEEEGAGGSTAKGQLYAGRSAVGEVVGKTDGREDDEPKS